MLVSWFPPHTRAFGVPYAAGFGVVDDPRRPDILDGDAELFHYHDYHSPYLQSHIAYALCFDRLIPRDAAAALHHQILNAILPARLDAAVMTLGIQHTEPGPIGARDRTAIHSFVSCRDLLRGRFFQPAFQAEGQYRIELAQELINQSAPFSSPKDPEYARSVSISTRPRGAGRAEVLRTIRSAVRLIGDDLLAADSLFATLRACGVTDIEIDDSQPGQCAASFSFAPDESGKASARIVVRPGQAEKLMRGSSLRRLMGDCYVRSPEKFELMRGEFLTQVARAADGWSQKHDADLARFESVLEWGQRLSFVPLAKAPSRSVSEVFDRIPTRLVPPRIISHPQSDESMLNIPRMQAPRIDH